MDLLSRQTVRSEPANGWMGAIASDAERMPAGSPDWVYRITAATSFLLCVQEEEDGKSWWVRWVREYTGDPIAGYACDDLLQVIASVATILDRAGVPIGK
jgi:hypothetical protein